MQSLCLFFSVASHLAAPPAVEVIGFSSDDRFVAFVEHGLGEGSGLPWARLTVLEVQKSIPAAPVVRVTPDGGADPPTEAATIEKARAALGDIQKKLGVTTWVPARKIALGKKGELQERSGAPLGNLEIKTGKSRRGGRCERPFAPQVVKATLFLLGDDGPRRLFEEKAAPKGRSCSAGCQLHAVYAQGKAVLAFATCKVPGFEGGAEALTPLTGTVPNGLDEPLPEQGGAAQ